ncbi:hypothetical protein [Nocardia asiatica]|uniref:hypothetical protein n=1 Tax=Nocardia asiatica TaxID=209252 RepID=UPI0024572B0B|nr:hypothetical protein [Nocardia asiatica]
MHNTNRACFTCGESTTAGNLFCAAHLLKWHPRADNSGLGPTHQQPHPRPIYRPF